MLPENIQWYFPSTINEASKLIKKQGTILHAGGTRILKTDTKSIKALVDISKLGLNYIKGKGNKITVGSGSTFSDIVDFHQRTGKLAILAKALREAASNPLRNRITIGGSIKDFPLWSSLYAPLIALNASIKVLGQNAGIYPVEDYVSENIIKKKHIVKEIIVKEVPGFIYGVKRFSVIKFEYPVFTIAIAFKIQNMIIKNARFVITGVQGRYKRFKRAENVFINKALSDELIDKSLKYILPHFVSDYKYSSKYKETISHVFFKDLLNELKDQINES